MAEKRDKGAGSIIQCCPPILPQHITQLLLQLLEHCKTTSRIDEVIDAQTFVMICHRAIECFKETGTVAYVHDPEGMGIFGDLHGCFPDLLRGLMRTGWPSEHSLIFMGDYVDRGQKTLQLVFFMFLLKIRYPDRVTMLCGNHETETGQQTMRQVIQVSYPEYDAEFLYRTLMSAFYYMPIAAVVSDQVYCCHGGISQFSRTLADIAAIEKPINSLKSMHLRQIATLTDTLWSDPTEEPASSVGAKYLPNTKRRCSYLYTKEAVFEKLRQYKIRAVVRGHQLQKEGYEIQFGGRLITIHSTSYSLANHHGAVLTLRFNPSNGLLIGVPHPYKPGKCDVVPMIDYFANILTVDDEQNLFPIPPRMNCSVCSFITRCPKILMKAAPSYDHITMVHMIWDISRRCSGVRRIFEDIAKIRDDFKRTTFAAKVFPQLMEILIEHHVVNVVESLKDDRPTYDFSEKLPKNINDWPPLIAGEVKNEIKGALEDYLLLPIGTEPGAPSESAPAGSNASSGEPKSQTSAKADVAPSTGSPSGPIYDAREGLR